MGRAEGGVTWLEETAGEVREKNWQEGKKGREKKRQEEGGERAIAS
jgi:hypothetical protein